MKDTAGNHYEKAFECWLKDNRCNYLPIDQHQRLEFPSDKIKRFDFAFSLPDSTGFLAEVKGRKFSGNTMASFGRLASWVTADDIAGLESWLKILDNQYQGLFVFAYELENIDVDTDGREIFEFEGRRYVFIAVKVEDYKNGAKARSPKWQTVNLSSAYYKKCAIDLDKLVSKKVEL